MGSRRIGAGVRLAVFAAVLFAVCLFLFLQPNKITVFRFSKLGTTITDTHFVSRSTDIVLAGPSGARVYYTTDGSEPDENAQLYTQPIALQPASGDFPNCLLLKAVAYYSDGTTSDVVTHTLWAHTQIQDQFQSLVLSISGDPAQLTDAPDGILYGENVWLRGPESEREVYVETVSPGGKQILSQKAGARPYGGASRGVAIKSLKLYARAGNGEKKDKFNFDLFGTLGANGEIIDSYDRIVVRNAANDLFNGFIRDELNQRLAARAGYTDYQEVLPVTVYLNGVHYGFFWVHENYCNDFLQEKYGKGNGRFEVVESAERQKTVDESDLENAAAAIDFNKNYNALAYCDLTIEENYAKLCDFIDVENYLQNYAFNVYLNNTDWPHNNFKCYRYYAAEGEPYAEGQLDGRWRFLYHDIDYTLGIYGQDRSAATRNNLQELLTEGHRRYSPLFANLMKREDCKEFFITEIVRLKEGALAAENIEKELDALYSGCAQEIRRFYCSFYGESMASVEESAGYKIHKSSLELIRQFARKREQYMEQHLIEAFALPADYFG